MPRVFVSYAHESHRHRGEVQDLCDRLRSDGIAVTVDADVAQGPPQGFRRWMDETIDDADFVLLVASPSYLRRWKAEEPDGIGQGVTWEAEKLRQWLYVQPNRRNEKIIPIVFEGSSLESVPDVLRDYRCFRIPKEYLELLLRLRHPRVRNPVEDPGPSILGSATEQYMDWIRAKYDSLQIFGMTKAVKLTSVYTKLRVLDRPRASQTHEDQLGSVTQKGVSGGTRFIDQLPTRPSLEVLKENEWVALIGKPGCGKTTLCRYLALRSIHGDLGPKKIPILIELRRIETTDMDSPDFVLDLLRVEFASSGIKDPAENLIALLETGGCLLLFDGLDEVSDTGRSVLTRQVLRLAHRYPTNKFLVSCRTAAYGFWLEGFTVVEVADFGKEEISEFVENWFRDSPSTPEKFLQQLDSKEGTREIATTPLLLTMLCLEFQDTQTLSPTRAQLYRNAIEALLFRWDASRQIQRPGSYRLLVRSQKEALLQQIAAQTFVTEQYLFERSEIEAVISTYVEQTTIIGDDGHQADPAVILDDLMSHHGLIIERYKGVYSFVHLTLQEYLTAAYIAAKGPTSWEVLVREHLADSRWREVILLVANLLPDPTEYLFGVLRGMANLGFEPRHIEALRLKRPSEMQSILALQSRLNLTFVEPFRGPGSKFREATPTLAGAEQKLEEWRSRAADGFLPKLKDSLLEFARCFLTTEKLLELCRLSEELTTLVSDTIANLAPCNNAMEHSARVLESATIAADFIGHHERRSCMLAMAMATATSWPKMPLSTIPRLSASTFNLRTSRRASGTVLSIHPSQLDMDDQSRLAKLLLSNLKEDSPEFEAVSIILLKVLNSETSAPLQGVTDTLLEIYDALADGTLSAARARIPNQTGLTRHGLDLQHAVEDKRHFESIRKHLEMLELDHKMVLHIQGAKGKSPDIGAAVAQACLSRSIVPKILAEELNIKEITHGHHTLNPMPMECESEYHGDLDTGSTPFDKILFQGLRWRLTLPAFMLAPHPLQILEVEVPESLLQPWYCREIYELQGDGSYGYRILEDEDAFVSLSHERFGSSVRRSLRQYFPLGPNELAEQIMEVIREEAEQWFRDELDALMTSEPDFVRYSVADLALDLLRSPIRVDPALEHAYLWTLVSSDLEVTKETEAKARKRVPNACLESLLGREPPDDIA